MSGILSSLRVIDLGRYVAGPYCATLLGYLGADVIRIERPGGGEDRYVGPLGDDTGGSVFMQTGSNKRSVTLNLRHEKSREVLERLIGTADVLVANLPPAALERLGLSYERVHELNPRLILTTQTAFGNRGPWRERGGFDGVGQAMSGAAYMTGQPGEPAKAAAPYVDYATAVLSAFGTLAAIIERETSGEGQHVESTLLGTALAVFNSHLIEEGGLQLGREPSGNRVQTSGPSDVFKTSDGHVLLHVVGSGLFQRTAEAIGAEDWLNDPNLDTDAKRGDRRDELCERVQAWCADKPSSGILETMANAGVPAGPVLSPREVLEHPQVAVLELLKSMQYPGRAGTVPVADLPVALSRTPGGIERPPPEISEHTDEVLTELGYSGQELAAMRNSGAI